MAKTTEQKTNAVGFPKPGELIEVTGAHDLEASDRAMLNVLYQFAHDAGNLIEQDAEWEMPLGRLRSVKHKGNERVRDSLQRLMKTSVTIPFNDPKTGEAKVLITPLFEFFELSADESVTRATLRFGLPRKLRPVIACSARWGRIKAEVVCSMSSRYAMALYELVQLRANMERCVEVFHIARFRELLGVPPGAYQRGNDFARKVLQPATLEVCKLSDMGVTVEVRRRSPRAPIESVVVAWWNHEGDAYREAMRERERPKAGRKARLCSSVEPVAPQVNPRFIEASAGL